MPPTSLLSGSARYRSILALLISCALLLAGHGIVNTLVPLRAKLDGFGPLQLGLLGSVYYGGMLAGSILTPWLVQRSGHVRALTAGMALATMVTLVFAMHVSPWTWIPLRAVMGFCFAGLYATIESWLNGKAANADRGTILGVYSVVQCAAGAAGNQFLYFVPPTGFLLFSLAAVLLAAAVIPLALTSQAPPQTPLTPELRLKWLYEISPIGVVGTLLIGMANGTFWTMMPVYAAEIGLAPGTVGTLMAVITIGGAALQIPIGRVSDVSDRRYLLVAIVGVAAALELVLLTAGDGISTMLLFPIGFLLGSMVATHYYVAAAHTNDRTGPENAVGVSAALLLLYCIGAVIGPVVASWMMQASGPSGLFLHNLTVHAVTILFVLWRIVDRPAPERTAEPIPPRQPT